MSFFFFAGALIDFRLHLIWLFFYVNILEISSTPDLNNLITVREYLAWDLFFLIGFHVWFFSWSWIIRFSVRKWPLKSLVCTTWLPTPYFLLSWCILKGFVIYLGRCRCFYQYKMIIPILCDNIFFNGIVMFMVNKIFFILLLYTGRWCGVPCSGFRFFFVALPIRSCSCSKCLKWQKINFHFVISSEMGKYASHMVASD